MKDHAFRFTVTEQDGKRGIQLNSEPWWRHYFSKIPVGTPGTLIVSFKKPTRSQSQLAYYFVLCELIGDYIGETKEAVHDALVRLLWGEKEITIAGQTVKVRKSISDAAKMPKNEMGELITFALNKCNLLEIRVPTAEELGYITNY